MKYVIDLKSICAVRLYICHSIFTKKYAMFDIVLNFFHHKTMFGGGVALSPKSNYYNYFRELRKKLNSDLNQTTHI